MWKTDPNPNTSLSIYLSIIYLPINLSSTYLIFPIVGLLEETRGGEKEEENDRVTNSETHHVCVGTRHNKTLKMVERHRMEKGEEEWGYPDLAQCICSKMSRENHEQ
jgi:hypothetical protein